MNDSLIPGFTAAQSWTIRTIAYESARLAIAELEDKRCPFACEDMAGLRATIYGNGKNGLKTIVTRHDERIAHLLWWNGVTIVASLSTIGALVVALLS